MIKRTIEISRQAMHVTARLDQLILAPQGASPGGNAASIPCEDIGVVVVDHPQTTYSHSALVRLAEFNGTLVVCGRDHVPIAVLLPMGAHCEVAWRVNVQLSVSKPTCKRLWKQLVQAKIVAQASNLHGGSKEQERLLHLSREVRSGDPANVESQAARLYWSVWLEQASDRASALSEFRRDPNNGHPANAMLNYGYAVLRAAIARSLVAAGLLPVLGLHHSNRSNNFALADDLIEPLRPIVDHRVRKLLQQSRSKLDQPTKAAMLELLAAPVYVNDHQGPMMVQIHRMVASLVNCFQRKARDLDIPTLFPSGNVGCS